MEEKGFKILKLLKNPIVFLNRENGEKDSTFIAVVDPILSQEDSESSHKRNNMQIIYLKIQYEEVIKKNENLSNQRQEREAYCVSVEMELDSLRCDLEKENNQLSQYRKLEKSTKILDEIFISQRSPLVKTGLGFEEESCIVK